MAPTRCMAASRPNTCTVVCWALALLAVLGLNLHYVLLGESPVAGLFNSPLVEAGNALWRHKTIQALHEHGIPPSNHTDDLGNGLELDIYEPDHDSSDARPAALYFHAGAYALGFKELGAGTMRFLAHEGIVGISVGYRRSTKKGLDGSVDDAARALAWVREHASEIGVDPLRIFAVGDSAGGHIVLALALGLGGAAKVNPPSAIRSLRGPFSHRSSSTRWRGRRFSRLLDDAIDATSDRWREGSTISRDHRSSSSQARGRRGLAGGGHGTQALAHALREWGLRG